MGEIIECLSLSLSHIHPSIHPSTYALSVGRLGLQFTARGDVTLVETNGETGLLLGCHSNQIRERGSALACQRGPFMNRAELQTPHLIILFYDPSHECAKRLIYNKE